MAREKSPECAVCGQQPPELYRISPEVVCRACLLDLAGLALHYGADSLDPASTAALVRERSRAIFAGRPLTNHTLRAAESRGDLRPSGHLRLADREPPAGGAGSA